MGKTKKARGFTIVPFNVKSLFTFVSLTGTMATILDSVYECKEISRKDGIKK